MGALSVAPWHKGQDMMGISNRWVCVFALFSLALAGNGPAGAVENALGVFRPEDRRILELGFRGELRYHPIAAEILEEPRALLAPDEAPHLYRVIPESGSEMEELHRFVAVSEASGTARFEYQLNAAESQLLRVSDGQGVFIEGAVDRKEGVKTEFNPAKPLLPKLLSPGQSMSAMTKVRVLDLAHPEKVRHSGELNLTLTHLGSFHARVPAGEYETVLVRLESLGKIGPAEIAHRQYYFFAEDIGLVAFLESRRISAFAIYEKKEQQALVLMREGDGL
jgi:hypothetical protein